MIAIWASLSYLASSNNLEDQEDEDGGDAVLSKLSKEDKPSWVEDTISKTVPQRMGRFRQKEMYVDELTQPGYGDAAQYFGETAAKYSMPELKVLGLVKLQTDKIGSLSAPTTFAERMESVDIASRISPMA